MRTSNDTFINGRLIHGFDYDNQAWAKDGVYLRCGHPENMDCNCYGRIHAGEKTVVVPVDRQHGEVIYFQK